ncbi:mitochondrial coenzyme A diphosphatase NUDT8 isoform X3 [Cavia porcellus]|uniref:mitochondrial coenzyme A diphosphatase NUDT8 isoform X3 n=1 Tax=Cavia porcellus TaxID=10141 RepID=UPI002FE2A339
MPRSGSLAALSRLPAPAPPRSTREPVPSAAPHPSHGAGRPGRPRPRPPRFAKPGRQNRPAPPSAGRCPRCPRRADMVLDSLSAEGERCCRQLLRETTARFRARPAAAAVLVPLCLVRGVPALLYTLRSSRLAGRHKGDVSFPGGKCDPADQDVVHTALRETQEELGLAVPKEHVWGVMRPVYDRAKASVVPVLASVGQLDLQSLKPNPEEVNRGNWADPLGKHTEASPLSTLFLTHRWRRCLCCPWHTCYRHRIRVIPTFAIVATSATHFLSSCMDHTVSGDLLLSSRSSLYSC